MHEAHDIPTLIADHLNLFISRKRAELTELGPDIAPLLDEIKLFLEGGKRLRAQFLISGWGAIAVSSEVGSNQNIEDAPLMAASALEIFQAAALIHDDIIDKSDTRRGRASVHSSFTSVHEQNELVGSASHFGVSAAILIGDLLQSWADELLNDALELLPSRSDAIAARKIFNLMRSEVATGQYLDVLEEVRPYFAEHELQLERSTRVLIYKSAKYSVQAPILLGAAMAGATDAQIQSLADFGLPIGVAFQLRDDLLGIYGDPEVTGKPIGDDLREGKRTLLVTLARNELTPGPRRVFDEMHGSNDLELDQITMLQRTIEDSGAKNKVEQMISQNVGIAREALAESSFSVIATNNLLQLAEKATSRFA